MDYNLIGFLLVAAASLGIGAILVSRPGQPFTPRLVMAAIGVRIVGSLVRYEVLFRVYNGSGDATGYFRTGQRFSERLWAGDLTVFGYEQWFGTSRWWGTHFMENLSGPVVSVIGPTMRGEYLVFSMLSLFGLYLAALALWEACPAPVVRRYVQWVMFWPSLWYWPSSVGKEAVIIFATGLVILGYVGRANRVRWGLYAAGIGLAFAIRPHYGAFLAVASGLAQWCGSWNKLTPRHVAEAVMVAVLASFALSAMNTQFGIEEADLEGMQEFLTVKAEQTLKGGSNLGQLPRGSGATLQAFINIWMRPYPWEAHNATALLASAEVLLLWWVILRYRRAFLLPFKQWQENRLLRFAVIFLIGYTLLIGFTFGNMGIIARQRTPMFPFLFAILAMVSTAAVPGAVPAGSRLALPRLEFGRRGPVDFRNRPVTSPSLDRVPRERTPRWRTSS